MTTPQLISLHRTPERPYQREAIQALMRSLRVGRPSLLHIATGGGKTRIANDLVVARQARHEAPVLWITKDWRLLAQAARDLEARHLPGRDLRRLGGDGTVLERLSEDLRGSAVVYSTLQTFGRRHAAGTLGRLRPSLVVWDECHWGEHASAGRRLLRWCERRGVPVLGLTATPRRPDESVFRVAYSKDFASLVREGHLARPNLLAPVATGVRWVPELSLARGDFGAASLEELGRNRQRNELIVRHFAENRAAYGPTIVFACSVEHANRLATMFQAPPWGIPARAVHSHLPEAANEDAISAFARGEVDVLINVAMLTHGIDIPAVRTVFLCRPTLSDILFSQMLGRGSRLDTRSGKREFHVVEFTDNLEKFGAELVRAKSWFRGSSVSGPPSKPPRRSSSPRRLAPHAFSLQGLPRWIPDSPAYPDAMRGLWYRQGQTFGVEIELTRDDWDPEMSDEAWTRVAEPLRKALEDALGRRRMAGDVLRYYGSADKSHDVWNVERDNSCGWEVSSRVLANEEGFREIVLACEAIEKVAPGLGLKVNFLTGLHLHIGWLGRNANDVRRAIELARLFEPALATLVSPSRIAAFDGDRYVVGRPNRFCRPVSSVFRRRDLADLGTLRDVRQLCRDNDDRYVTFNVRPLNTIQTVEVRLHNGTSDAHKILLWLSLWQQILWAANGDRPIREVPDRKAIVPDGDIVALVREYLPQVDQPRFIERLERRRQEVADLWRRHDGLREWAAFAAAWQPSAEVLRAA